MNPNDPLADLADIHLPNSISAWPLAPGWWVLIILACAGLVALFKLWSKWHASRLYRRQALAQLNSIEASNNKISSNSQLVATLELPIQPTPTNTLAASVSPNSKSFYKRAAQRLHLKKSQTILRPRSTPNQSSLTR